jgi:fructokinase
MSTSLPLVGAIEAGGTKFVCAIGSGPGQILSRGRFPTDASGNPQVTVQACVEWFASEQRRLGVKIAALGIGSFGPVDLATQTITTTPKPGWTNFALGAAFRSALGVPVGFDTDVNAAALSEHRWGAGQGADPVVYITIGTGIGAGALVNGKLLHGALHPEMGHFLLPKAAGDTFAGVCPFHGACWEGLCSGPAMGARWNLPAEAIPADHPAWATEARYIAHGLNALLCILSPQRIILGGSVPKGGQLGQQKFFQLIYGALAEVNNGYLAIPQLAHPETYIVPAGLGDDAGALGCIALAHAALG